MRAVANIYPVRNLSILRRKENLSSIVGVAGYVEGPRLRLGTECPRLLGPGIGTNRVLASRLRSSLIKKPLVKLDFKFSTEFDV